MPIPVTCPRCQARFTLADTAAGKRCRCSKCGNVIAVGNAPSAGKSGPRKPTTTAKKAGKSAMPVLLLVGGLLLVLCAGGGGLAAFIFGPKVVNALKGSSAEVAEERVIPPTSDESKKGSPPDPSSNPIDKEPPADTKPPDPPDRPPPDKPPPDKPPADKPPADKPPADKPPADKPPADKPPPDKPRSTPDVEEVTVGDNGKEYKRATLHRVDSRFVVTVKVKGEEVSLRPGLFFAAFDASGQELPAFQHYRVFKEGNVLDLRTEKTADADREVIIQARLIKGSLREQPSSVRLGNPQNRAYDGAVVQKYENNRLTLQFEGKSLELSPRPGMMVFFTEKEPVHQDWESVLMPGNVVNVRTVKTKGDETISELHVVKGERMPPGVVGIEDHKNAVVKADKVATLLIDGKEVNVSLTGETRLFDLEGKQYAKGNPSLLLKAGNVVAVKLQRYRNPGQPPLASEMRLVKGATVVPPPVGPVVRRVVIKKRLGNEITPDLLVEQAGKELAVRPWNVKGFDEAGRSLLRYDTDRMFKVGNVVDAVCDPFQKDLELLTECRLVKGELLPWDEVYKPGPNQPKQYKGLTITKYTEGQGQFWVKLGDKEALVRLGLAHAFDADGKSLGIDTGQMLRLLNKNNVVDVVVVEMGQILELRQIKLVKGKIKPLK